MKLTKRKLSILTLALVILLALTAFFGLHAVNANAAGSVTVSGTNVFTATGDAEVIAHRELVGDTATDYTMFTFGSDDDAVSYRRNLAYNWYEVDKNDEYKGVNGLFNMEIGFETGSAFEKFIITFESQEYTKSKDGKAVNYIILFPAGEGKVNVLITSDKDAALTDKDKEVSLNADHITVKFVEKLAGAYSVEVGNNGGSAKVSGTFENVSGNYSKSSTSSSSPVYPLIFNAEFAEDSKDVAKMALYNLNGQAFALTGTTSDTDADGATYYRGGTVEDNMPPVLCMEEELTYFTLGADLDFDFEVIDVLRSSPSHKVYYYVLSYDRYKNEDGKITNYADKSEDGSLFDVAESDTLLETSHEAYLPDANDLKDTIFNVYNAAGQTEKLKVDMLVKVYVHLEDISSNTVPTDVYLDWYLPENCIVNLNGENASFIAVAKDELGVTYNYDGENGTSWKDSEIVAAYQKRVDEAAKNLSAGSSSYFYLPSAESLFADNATAYTDMKFNIYYYHDSQQSSTGNASNNLSINVSKQGAYTFTIYATDLVGNKMYYIDGDGAVKEFESSEIWTMFDDKDDSGLYYKLPWFNFNVSYTGVDFEEKNPGMQSTAYVGTSYSSASFKINGISGSYDTKYRLFLFDRSEYSLANNGETFTYEQFVNSVDDLFDKAETRKFFKEIPVVKEGDANYDDYKDYAWSGTSTTFVPQDANAFYVIRAEVTDKQYNTNPVTCNIAIVASVNAKSLPGESDWLKNNVASVVLLSVAGVALIAIILLLVIKPKDKGDIDEQFENAKKRRRKNKKQ